MGADRTHRCAESTLNLRLGPKLAAPEPGDIWWALLDDEPVGHEQSGRRPVVIISNSDYLGLVESLVKIVPVTMTHRGWPNHIPLRGATSLAGYAMSEQVRTISRERLLHKDGGTSASCLAEIHTWIVDFLLP